MFSIECIRKAKHKNNSRKLTLCRSVSVANNWLPYLIAGLAFALLVTTMNPVVVSGSLLSVLSWANISERWFTRELDILHQRWDTVCVCYNLARAAL